MGDSAYSFSLTTFSRTGKLLQIEYALMAVQQGKTSLGIKGEREVEAQGGVAEEKRLLLVPP